MGNCNCRCSNEEEKEANLEVMNHQNHTRSLTVDKKFMISQTSNWMLNQQDLNTGLFESEINEGNHKNQGDK